MAEDGGTPAKKKPGDYPKRTFEKHLRADAVTGVYYVRAMVGGERHKVSTEETSLKRAIVVRDRLMTEWRDAARGWRRKSPTFAVWWERFAASYLRGYAANTRQVFVDSVKRTKRLFDKRPLDEVTKSLCVQCVNALADRGFAASTIQTTAACLHRVFQAAIDDGYLTVNPWRKVDLEKPKPRTRVLTPEEQAKLFAVMDPDHVRWCRVLLGTGLRVSELLGLRPQDIDFPRRLMTVTGKGNKTRAVPILREVAPLLEAQLRLRKLPADSAKRLWLMTRKTCGLQLRTKSKKAGIALVTPHTLRHTYATRFIESGRSIAILSLILGHASPQITARIYVHASSDSLVVEADRAMLGANPEGGKVIEFPAVGGTKTGTG